jgi:hypothetical protein
VTIGQVGPTVFQDCNGQLDVVQPTVNSGASYVVPGTGGVTNWTVTSWSTRATSDAGQTMTLKIFRLASGPSTYTVIGHDGPRTLLSGLNQFQSHVAAQTGDILGSNWSGSAGACTFFAASQAYDYRSGDLGDGGTAPFSTDATHDSRANISAEITPTGDFAVNKPRTKPNGTAILTMRVPNPGVLSVSGGGAKASSSGATKQVPAAGKVKVVIKAKGLKKRQLGRKGKVTVKPKITFTPTGGIPTSEFRKIKLHRRH